MSSTQTEHRFVALSKAAEYLAVNPRTIRRAVAEGRLTGYRFGDRVLRVDLNELDAAMSVIPTVDGAA